MDLNVKKLKINDELSNSNRIISSAICPISGSSVIAIYCSDSTIRIYNFDINKSGFLPCLIAAPLNCHYKITAWTWLNQSAKLIVGCENGSIRIYDIEKVCHKSFDYELVEVLLISNLHSSPITFLSVNHTDDFLVSNCSDGTVQAGLLNSGDDSMTSKTKLFEYSAVASFQESESRVVCISFSRKSSFPKNRVLPDHNNEKTSLSFIVGLNNGTIIEVFDDKISEITKVSGDLHSLNISNDTTNIVALTLSPCAVIVFNANNHRESKRIKLDIGENPQVCWISPTSFCTLITGESRIRWWNIERGEYYDLSSIEEYAASSSRYLAICYLTHSSSIVALTQTGYVFVWKRPSSNSFCCDNQETLQWELCCHHQVSIEFSHGTGLTYLTGSQSFYISTPSHIYCLSENSFHCAASNDVIAAQVNKTSISLVKGEVESGPRMYVNVDKHTRFYGIALAPDRLVLHSRDEIITYDIDCDLMGVVLHSNISVRSQNVRIYNDKLIMIQENRIIFTDFEGISKLSITVTEGNPIAFAINGNYLVIATHNMVFKLILLQDKEYKYISKPVRMSESNNLRYGRVSSLSCNVDGTKVSFLIDTRDIALGIWVPDSRFFVYDVISEITVTFDMSAHKCIPTNHTWDVSIPTLVCCDTINDESRIEGRSAKRMKKYFTFFAIDGQLYLQSQTSLENCNLIKLSIPYIYLKYDVIANSDSPFAFKILLSDFSGFDGADRATQDILIKFAILRAMGNTEEAIRVLRTISSPTIWEKLAHECVRSRRVDIAEICLACMGYASGALSVKVAKLEPEQNVAIATLAIQLGLLEDAVKLYTECKRFDLLIKFYISQGQWDKAMDIAAHYDRIRLKNVQFQYAEYLVINQKYDLAVKYYEKAGATQTMIPNLFYTLKRMSDLEAYAEQKNDTSLFKWIASYYESQGHIQQAYDFYSKAKDSLSLVRISCSSNDFDGAFEIIKESGCKVSSYFVARQLESRGDIREAINLYRSSGSFNHAIRLAKAYGLDAELMAFALKCQPSVMHSVAQYFEEKNEIEKSSTLYSKCGESFKAFALAESLFRGKQDVDEHVFELFHSIFATITDPNERQVYHIKYGEMLIQSEFFDIAAEFYVLHLKQFDRAIEICSQYDIHISEPLTNVICEHSRSDRGLLLSLANLLKRNGKHLDACKVYTLAYDRINALKSLVRGGLTMDIIKYARVSRDKEIFVLSANYLQHLDWKRDDKIRDTIIEFYTRGKDFDKLQEFENACIEDSSSDKNSIHSNESEHGESEIEDENEINSSDSNQSV